VLQVNYGVNILHSNIIRHAQGDGRIAEDAANPGLDQGVRYLLGRFGRHGDHTDLARAAVQRFANCGDRFDHDRRSNLVADFRGVVVEHRHNAEAAMLKAIVAGQGVA